MAWLDRPLGLNPSYDISFHISKNFIELFRGRISSSVPFYYRRFRLFSICLLSPLILLSVSSSSRRVASFLSPNRKRARFLPICKRKRRRKRKDYMLKSRVYAKNFGRFEK